MYRLTKTTPLYVLLLLSLFGAYLVSASSYQIEKGSDGPAPPITDDDYEMYTPLNFAEMIAAIFLPLFVLTLARRSLSKINASSFKV